MFECDETLVLQQVNCPVAPPNQGDPCDGAGYSQYKKHRCEYFGEGCSAGFVCECPSVAADGGIGADGCTFSRRDPTSGVCSL